MGAFAKDGVKVWKQWAEAATRYLETALDSKYARFVGPAGWSVPGRQLVRSDVNARGKPPAERSKVNTTTKKGRYPRITCKTSFSLSRAEIGGGLRRVKWKKNQSGVATGPTFVIPVLKPKGGSEKRAHRRRAIWAFLGRAYDTAGSGRLTRRGEGLLFGPRASKPVNIDRDGKQRLPR